MEVQYRTVVRPQPQLSSAPPPDALRMTKASIYAANSVLHPMLLERLQATI